ncbi:hypothetical protein [Symbiobacterium thermophilum]|uniref:Uncharacterized protein n=1 Tax=Symbiobacterium thermophilum TaxID=2734 RepID=A0A953LI67_SYMTR|nr:hypothetical protein [Symbiobacterium thermophilum]MBY6277988.1 hypothetical protein [Symbiobacterium thermophilum]
METFGTLVFLNGQAFLQLEIGELIALNDSFIIEALESGQTIALDENYAGKTILIRKEVA